MQSVFDDVARILASPLPRRQALKLVGGALAGGVLGALGVNPAAAQSNATKCKIGTFACGTGCCSSNTQTCCTTGTSPFCVSKGKICCGSTSCSNNQTCCTTGSKPFCATKGKTCCGSTSCSSDQTCCNGTCCAKGQKCVNGRCEASKSGPTD